MAKATAKATTEYRTDAEKAERLGALLSISKAIDPEIKKLKAHFSGKQREDQFPGTDKWIICVSERTSGRLDSKKIRETMKEDPRWIKRHTVKTTSYPVSAKQKPDMSAIGG